MKRKASNEARWMACLAPIVVLCMLGAVLMLVSRAQVAPADTYAGFATLRNAVKKPLQLARTWSSDAFAGKYVPLVVGHVAYHDGKAQVQTVSYDKPGTDTLLIALRGGTPKEPVPLQWLGALDMYTEFGSLHIITVPGASGDVVPLDTDIDTAADAVEAVLSDDFVKRYKNVAFIARGWCVQVVARVLARKNTAELAARTSRLVLVTPEIKLRRLGPLRRIPMLLVWGEHDAILSRVHGERIASRVFRSELATVRGLHSHFPETDSPEQFERLVRNWWTKRAFSRRV